ncbi:unnamed protein product [Calypogeia fissa]
MICESGDEFKRPMGTKKAKDKLKKAKIEESALKTLAQAQLQLAAVGRDKVKVTDDDPQPTTTPPMDEAVCNPLGCNVEPYGYGTGEFHDLI